MDAQKWGSLRESVGDCIGGPTATHIKLGGNNRKTMDRGKQDVLQTMLHRKMLTLKNYDVKLAP